MISDANVLSAGIFMVAYLFGSYHAYKAGRSKHGMDLIGRMREEIVPTEGNIDTLTKVLDILNDLS